jgi:hypothetical protein
MAIIRKGKKNRSSDIDVAEPTAIFGKMLWQEMNGRKSRGDACHIVTTTRSVIFKGGSLNSIDRKSSESFSNFANATSKPGWSIHDTITMII